MVQAGRSDIVAARHAISPFARINPAYCRLDPGAFLLAAAVLGLGHGLLLHGVHPAQPAHTVLLQSDRGARLAADCAFLRQLRRGSRLSVAVAAVRPCLHLLAD